MSTAYHWDGSDLILQIRAQPRASRNQWDGLVSDSFRVRLTAPPVEGQANIHLQQFLAELFGVPKTHITLLAGAASRIKRLRITAPKRWPLEIEPEQVNLSGPD